MMTFDNEGEGVQADDYLIKHVPTFHKFFTKLANFALILKTLFEFGCTN